MSKTRHFKFGVHIDIDEHEYIRDRLFRNGMRSV